ncbi:suppressor of SWI4 1 homolog isoform X2 [Corticium candelabrum]|uniref:suppressor of SWI4 1 homolog isoform X2 n=1 Tax=Corticium candelabrum TaxID=121492 RepID=UPI002E25D46D|nr:suppressor of SWI4 1 homolog isoform X2 [Corticium candelabrum]
MTTLRNHVTLIGVPYILGMKKHGKKRGTKNKRKLRAAQKDQAIQELGSSKVPRSFVLHRGTVGRYVQQLALDTRKLMEPYTASHLKVKRNNVLKDFVHIAGPLGVTHLIFFTKSENSVNMRIGRLPRGPTLTFQVLSFSLMSDVLSSLKKPRNPKSQYKHPAMLMMNNFPTNEKHMKLVTSVIQNAFPSINIQKVKLRDIERCVLMQYDTDTNSVEVRHYNIRAVPLGLSRQVKKLVQAKVPSLGKYDDISDFLLGGNVSESEVEDAEESHVLLPQPMPGRGNEQANQSAVRLTELGPRLSLKLLKVEAGLCDGEVLFHQFVTKSKTEVKSLREKKIAQRKLKDKRRRLQEANVKRKEKLKEAHRARCAAGVKTKQQSTKQDNEDGSKSDDGDDDIQWYKQEVGEEPDPDLFQSMPSPVTKIKQRKRQRQTSQVPPAKKRKVSSPQVKQVDKKGDRVRQKRKIKSEGKDNTRRHHGKGQLKKKVRFTTGKFYSTSSYKRKNKLILYTSR